MKTCGLQKALDDPLSPRRLGMCVTILTEPTWREATLSFPISQPASPGTALPAEGPAASSSCRGERGNKAEDAKPGDCWVTRKAGHTNPPITPHPPLRSNLFPQLISSPGKPTPFQTPGGETRRPWASPQSTAISPLLRGWGRDPEHRLAV